MTTQINKYHAGVEAPILLKKKCGSESSEGNFRGMKASKVQSALAVVKQVLSYSAEQLNVIFIVNIILKMGLPVFMADDKGFREWLEAIEVSMHSERFNHSAQALTRPRQGAGTSSGVCRSARAGSAGPL